jgi:single-stranded-DNA-specific exonuclease
MMKIKIRDYPIENAEHLVSLGVPKLMAKLLAARGVEQAFELDHSIKNLINPESLTNNKQMGILLADAIVQQKSILVVGDYDADGATATAVAIRGLRAMGANVDFLVPNRFEYGYGLTPEIVALAQHSQPDIILTVDNGIASIEGVAYANRLGMQVLITDHHLPAEQTPEATCIVNPNQRSCAFPSKHLAGVGVMFYVLLALRAELRARDLDGAQFNLAELLDLVALGTVADLVKLDTNNRILVEQGLRRIRAGASCVGIQAILKLAGKDASKTSAQDLGFYVGPRLNAAGRLDDMTLGIKCLITDNKQEALTIAQQLHELNTERRQIEGSMQIDAIDSLDEHEVANNYAISLYQADWHQGVVGILASRIKEQYHRPVIAFAQADDGLLKGSGRSINGLHLRDALDLVTKQRPNLIVKFGGHAMAAGLSIREQDFEVFKRAFEQVVRSLITEDALQASIETDGALPIEEMTMQTAQMLDNQVWGQGFPPPLFSDDFKVLQQRIVGDKHLKLSLARQQQRFDAIWFNQTDLLDEQVRVVYQLQINEFNGNQSLQLLIRHADASI